MDQKLLAMLNESERALLRDTESGRLDRLDEDELLELHGRVRRARTKYSKLYRRRAAEQVTVDSSRGRASAANTRTRLKAEIFEDALAGVSRRLAAVAKASAAELRSQRLAAARDAGRPSAPAKKASAGKKPARKARAKQASAKRSTVRSQPISKKSAASSRAAGARRQAARDSR